MAEACTRDNRRSTGDAPYDRHSRRQLSARVRPGLAQGGGGPAGGLPALSYSRPDDCPRSLSAPEAAGGHAGTTTPRQGPALVLQGLQAHDLDAARYLSPLPAVHL